MTQHLAKTTSSTSWQRYCILLCLFSVTTSTLWLAPFRGVSQLPLLFHVRSRDESVSSTPSPVVVSRHVIQEGNGGGTRVFEAVSQSAIRVRSSKGGNGHSDYIFRPDVERLPVLAERQHRTVNDTRCAARDGRERNITRKFVDGCTQGSIWDRIRGYAAQMPYKNIY